MKKHKIPIQLSQYAHFIVGSSRSILEIKKDSPYHNTEKITASSFINNSLDLLSDHEQHLMSIKLNQINNLLAISNNVDEDLILNISVKIPQISKKNVWTPIHTKIETLHNSNKNIIKNLTPIYFNQNYEFCPLSLNEEAFFYYGVFLDQLTEGEKNIFLTSKNFMPQENKIGGYLNYNFSNFNLKSHFDFSKPTIPFICINNKLFDLKNKFSFIILMNEQNILSLNFKEFFSFICFD